MKEKLKLRDLLAFPVLMISTLTDSIALRIGGAWTAEVFLEGIVKSRNKIKDL